VAATALVVNAITPTLAVVSVVVAPQQVAATSVATGTVTTALVVLTTAHRVATSETNNPALMPAKMVVVLTRPVGTTATTTVAETVLSNALRPLTPGIVATAVLPPVQTLAKMARVKVAVAGKTAAVTTAMQLAQRHVALQVLATSLHAGPSNLVPATSNPTQLRAKAQLANAAAHVC
jgi:hypothetical protein